MPQKSDPKISLQRALYQAESTEKLNNRVEGTEKRPSLQLQRIPIIFLTSITFPDLGNGPVSSLSCTVSSLTSVQSKHKMSEKCCLMWQHLIHS